MRRLASGALIVVAGAAMTLTVPLAPWAGRSWGEPPAAEACNPACQTDLQRARVASAKYRDVAVALSEGFVPASECVEGQAIHFVNPLRSFDTRVEVTEPDVLLYAPRGAGGLQLVGIEHLKVDQDQDLATDEDRPELYGQAFQGPMPGHDPLQATPVHYDLHVWLWSDHPAGIFAHTNPAVSCP